MKDFLYLVQIDEITLMNSEKSHVLQFLFILADGLILPILIACRMNQTASVVRLDIDDILDIFKDSLPIAADSRPFYGRRSVGASVRAASGRAMHLRSTFSRRFLSKGFII